MKGSDGMGRTEAQKRADKKSHAKIYEKISFDARRELRLRELINLAASKRGLSFAQYVYDIIQSQLIRDGITIDMLPTNSKYTPPATESKQPKRYMIYMVTTWDATPEEYEEVLVGNSFVFEEYVSVFQTLAMAKKYIANKYTKKPYPDQWYFTIYGREIEAENKLEAANKYRQMTKDAIAEENEGLYSEEGTEDFTELLNKYRKPDYVEIVKYDDVRDDKEGS